MTGSGWGCWQGRRGLGQSCVRASKGAEETGQVQE